MALSHMNIISSDVESNVDDSPQNIETAPKDQLSSLFQKLQGRATDYKKKYRDLSKSYQEIVRENEKCKVNFFMNFFEIFYLESLNYNTG